MSLSQALNQFAQNLGRYRCVTDISGYFTGLFGEIIKTFAQIIEHVAHGCCSPFHAPAMMSVIDGKCFVALIGQVYS